MPKDEELPTPEDGQTVVERLGERRGLIRGGERTIRATGESRDVPNPMDGRVWGMTPIGDLIAKARALATRWREDGGGVDAGALVDLVYAVEALTPRDGQEGAVAIDAAVALLRGEGFTVTSPGVMVGLICPACGADYGEAEAKNERLSGIGTDRNT